MLSVPGVPQVPGSVGLSFSHRPRKAPGRESDKARRKQPRIYLDAVLTCADGGIFFFEFPRVLRIDIENRKTPELTIRRSKHWAGGEQLTSLVQLS